MLKVGITGGLGAGKTTVANLFAETGVPVIDTDAISHELTSRDGEAITRIRETFGKSVFKTDGALDRSALRAKILESDADKLKLEAILHPMIRNEVVRRLGEQKASYVLVAIPLLVETGAYDDLLDRVLVVDCAEETQVKRALARGGWSEPEIRAMVEKQVSREVRLDRADDVIGTDCSMQDLQARVLALHEKYRVLARQAL